MDEQLSHPWDQLGAPEPLDTDQTIIQWLRDEQGVVHFPAEGGQKEAYVKAPAATGVIHEFSLLRATDGDDWHQTTIDPLALTRTLQERLYHLEHETDSPFAEYDD